MSTIYISEPPTKGKIVLTTSYGPLDIELWPKEAPKACRNFVQLCIDGYYDNTIFHRIIKSFMVQGGDPTGTGTGGQSIYGAPFSDEFHSRLRFNHRGLVACANTGTPNSNGSQFFITLDRCDWLDKKNTIFGKVTGDSVYNLLNFGDIETDKDDRPLESPPKLISVEVLWNPFDDIIPRVVEPDKTLQPGEKVDSKETKKKATKKLNLLSFGEEAEEEERESAGVSIKIRSSHDVLNDPRLLKESYLPTESKSSEATESKLSEAKAVRDVLKLKKESSGFDKSIDNSDGDDDESNFDTRMRLQILKKRKELGDLPKKQSLKSLKTHTDVSEVPEISDERQKVEKLWLKKKGIGSEARAERMANADSDLQLLGEAERERQMQKQKKRRRQGHEDEILAKLAKFKSSMSEKAVEESDARTGDDLTDWTNVKLKFTRESKESMRRNEDPNDYVVVDPLLEKGKEKFNKMQAKQKRREREWAGKSLT